MHQALTERQQLIEDEITSMERLQRLADKVRGATLLLDDKVRRATVLLGDKVRTTLLLGDSYRHTVREFLAGRPPRAAVRRSGTSLSERPSPGRL